MTDITAITEKQAENLRELAKLLRAQSWTHRFTMSTFLEGEDGTRDDPATGVLLRNQCGTSACAVGTAALSGGRFAPRAGDTWESYCGRLFGASPLTDPRIFDWLFSEVWYHHPTQFGPEAVANRIDIFLADGIPAGFADGFDIEDWGLEQEEDTGC